MRSISFICAVFALALTACVPSENVSGANNGEWELNNDANNTAGTNNSNNTTAGTNNANNTTNNITGETNNTTPPTFAEQLVTAPWTGFLAFEEIEAPDDAGLVGAAPRVRFRADGSVDLSIQTTREGRWEVTPTGEVVVTNLPQLEPDDPDRLLFEIEDEGGVVTSLKLVLGLTERIVFEQVDDVDGDVTIADIEGRWRSLEKVRGSEGGEFDLAMRFFDDGFDYGGVVPNQGFVSFAKLPGRVVTFSSGLTVWLWDAPAGNADTLPLAGEIKRSADGALTVWSLYAYEPADAQDILYAVPMEQVASFDMD